MFRSILLFVCVSATVLVQALAQTSHHGHGHDNLHAWYSTLERDDGLKCCSNQDCRPTLTREKGGDVEVMIDGEWYKVPPGRILKTPSRDLQSRVCAPKPGKYRSHFGEWTVLNGTIYCVVLGSGA